MVVNYEIRCMLGLLSRTSLLEQGRQERFQSNIFEGPFDYSTDTTATLYHRRMNVLSVIYGKAIAPSIGAIVSTR